MTLTSPHMRALVFDGPAPDTRCTRVIQVRCPTRVPDRSRLTCSTRGSISKT
jgi:hypothetical protein